MGDRRSPLIFVDDQFNIGIPFVTDNFAAGEAAHGDDLCDSETRVKRAQENGVCTIVRTAFGEGKVQVTKTVKRDRELHSAVVQPVLTASFRSQWNSYQSKVMQTMFCILRSLVSTR